MTRDNAFYMSTNANQSHIYLTILRYNPYYSIGVYFLSKV